MGHETRNESTQAFCPPVTEQECGMEGKGKNIVESMWLHSLAQMSVKQMLLLKTVL